MRDLLGRHRHTGAIRRRQPRALLKTRQGVAPSCDSGVAILSGDPRQVIPVRRHPRQGSCVPVPRVERQQLPHQHRHRPAVHQQVMVGQHQPMLIGRQPDQRKPKERRAAQVEALAAVFLQDAGQPLLALRRIQQRQVDAAPGRLRARHDHLHRPAQPLMPERRPQAGMALDQRLRGRFECVLLQPALQRKDQLHRIDVGRPRIIKRMEQQPLLQRRQRQDVLELRILALQTLDLVLRQRHQRQVAGRAAAGIWLLGMAHQRCQRPEPALRQIVDVFFTRAATAHRSSSPSASRHPPHHA